MTAPESPSIRAVAEVLRLPGVRGHHFTSEDGTDGGYAMHDADEMAAALLTLPSDRRAALAAELLDVETLGRALHDVPVARGEDCGFVHGGDIGSVRLEFGLPSLVPWPPPAGKEPGWDESEAGVREAISLRLREVDAEADAYAWGQHRATAHAILARLRSQT